MIPTIDLIKIFKNLVQTAYPLFIIVTRHAPVQIAHLVVKRPKKLLVILT
jgi:hypothetical protein